LTVGAVVSILGTVANSVLAGPRYLYAVAKDGFLPEWLGTVHPRFRTPAAAITLQTLVSLPLALTGGFVELAALSVVARLATYLGTAAAVPVLRRRFGNGRGFRLPGGPLIPIAASMLVIGLALSASSRNLIAAAIALGIGAVLFVWFGRRRAR
jgi:amino acid transporter